MDDARGGGGVRGADERGEPEDRDAARDGGGGGGAAQAGHGGLVGGGQERHRQGGESMSGKMKDPFGVVNLSPMP